MTTNKISKAEVARLGSEGFTIDDAVCPDDGTMPRWPAIRSAADPEGSPVDEFVTRSLEAVITKMVRDEAIALDD